jgi:crotonobetainyl-CoA:carnitine CoA-transferase CaiB-like acyl-CoA transferase
VSETGEDVSLVTTRAPVRFNSQPIKNATGAPRIGEHNEKIEHEFFGKD